jgi:hypothetical protein
MKVFYCLTVVRAFRLCYPKTEDQVTVFISPSDNGGPVTPSCTGFPFRRLLRLAGLLWKYSNQLQPGGTLDLSSCFITDHLQQFLYYCARIPYRDTYLFSRYLAAGGLTIPPSHHNFFSTAGTVTICKETVLIVASSVLKQQIYARDK